MTYLLDTCILSRIRKLKILPEPKLSKWFKNHPETEYYISAISLGEIERGISKLPFNDHGKAVLEEWFHGHLIPQFDSRILEFGKQAALRWGKLMAENEKCGRILPIQDAQITAIASVHSLIIVTFNEKDFKDLGIEVLNPLKL